MKEEKLLDAFGQIDEHYIIEAAPMKKEKKGKKGKRYAWVRWVAVAACVCIICIAASDIFKLNHGEADSNFGTNPEFEMTGGQESAENGMGEAVKEEFLEGEATENAVAEESVEEAVTEESIPEVAVTEESATEESVTEAQTEAMNIEPMEGLSLEQAALHPEFGILFPTEIMNGYVLEEKVLIYNETVLVARFHNKELEDELTIKIAKAEWFSGQDADIELDTVNYDGTSSYIYIVGGNYIAQYMCSNVDIAENENFYDMVYSAAQFNQCEVIE